MSSLHLDGARIAYAERGVGDPPLVFIHGWCCDGSHFAPQMEYFSKRHRCVALDQRGFGASEKPHQEYTIDGFADDLAALCGKLSIDDPVLVGHSLGGAVALATAARHPDLAAAVALCDPACFFSQSVVDATPVLLAGLRSEAWRDVAGGFVRTALFGDGDDPVLVERVTTAVLGTPRHVMRSALEALLTFDAESAALRCSLPVLHIEADAPLAERVRLEAACAHLRVVRTPGVGHFHQLLAPDVVNGHLEAFLADEVG